MFANSTLTGRNSTSSAYGKDSLNGESAGVTVAKSIVFFTTIVATLLGNSLIYASMKKFRSLRTPTNIVLCSLATTDLTMVVVMVLHAVTDLSGHWEFEPIWCDVVATIGLVLALISILHLCFLSIDRFVAIKNPLRYPVLVTRRRVYVLLVLIWILPAVFLNLPAADYHFRSEVYGCALPHNYTTSLEISPYIFIIVTFFVAIPFGIMFYTHTVVFCIALSHVKRMSTVERRLQEATTTTETSEINRETVHLHRHKPHTTVLLKREIKSAKTFALVIGVFLFCYTPFFITGTYRKVVGPAKVPAIATFVTTWLAFANSFSNPLVYSLRYSPFKRAFTKLCRVRIFNGKGESSITFSQQTRMSRLQREKRIDNIQESASITFKREEYDNKLNEHKLQNGIEFDSRIITQGDNYPFTLESRTIIVTTL